MKRTGRRPRVAILGCGAVGRALAVELLDDDRPSAVRGELRVWSRSKRSIRKFQALARTQTRRPWQVAPSAEEAFRRSDVLLLCVADAAVATVARRLAKARDALHRQVVLVTNGYLPLQVLAPLRRGGCAVARLHPLAPIPAVPASEVTALNMAAFAVEGDARALRVAKDIVEAIDGKSLVLRGRDAAQTYHAGASLLSGGIVALFHVAERVMSGSVSSRSALQDALDRFAETTLDNIYAVGPRKALTGAVSRGSDGLVRGHLRALRSDPQALELYRLLGGVMLELAHARGSIDARQRRQLQTLLARRRDGKLAAAHRSLRRLGPLLARG